MLATRTAPAQLLLYSTCDVLLTAAVGVSMSAFGWDWCAKPDARRDARTGRLFVLMRCLYDQKHAIL